MSNEGHLAENPSTRVVELILSQSNFKYLQGIMPKGYSLELVTKKRETTPKPVKKLLTNDGVGAKQRSINSDVESVESASRREGLREQRKIKTSHLEHRYADFEASTTTTKTFKSNNNEGVKKCLNLLQKLKKHQSSYPFLEPVDYIGLGLHDYPTVITEPMDISTVENKLKNGEYSTVHDFAADVRKIWNNAFKYNPKGSAIYFMTSQMSSHFERLFKEIEDVNFNPAIYNLQKKVEKMTRKVNEVHGGGASRSSYSAKPFKGSEVPMTLQEMRILGQKIQALPPDGLRGVSDIVVAHQAAQNQEPGCVEIDLNKLTPHCIRELERYVNARLQSLSKSMKKKGKEFNLNFDIPQTAEYSYDADHVATEQHESITQLSSFNSKVDTAASNHNDDAESHSSESSFLSE